jgi:uncharacterized glyoxalase superfamily protein PhnB
MRATNTYLTFDGNCREAMTFYGKCLQAEPNFTPFSAGPAEMPPAAKAAPDRILHVELASGPMVLMASDTMPGMPFRQGNNFSICIDCESQAKLTDCLRHSAKTVKSLCHCRTHSGVPSSACSRISSGSTGCSTFAMPAEGTKAGRRSRH